MGPVLWQLASIIKLERRIEELTLELQEEKEEGRRKESENRALQQIARVGRQGRRQQLVWCAGLTCADGWGAGWRAGGEQRDRRGPGQDQGARGGQRGTEQQKHDSHKRRWDRWWRSLTSCLWLVWVAAVAQGECGGEPPGA